MWCVQYCTVCVHTGNVSLSVYLYARASANVARESLRVMPGLVLPLQACFMEVIRTWLPVTTKACTVLT